MRRLLWGVVCLFVLLPVIIMPSAAKAEEVQGNNNPIILVHGFFGWGRDEMLGLKYWGGVHDIQENLKKEGYHVHTAAIGPVSSNWDRACELYAQINGGTVDYGAAHAAKHGHARYGRTYTGFVPNWSEDNKVHLVGHSMGGQTIRTLTQLLKEGSEEEKAYATAHGQQLSPLFEGGKSYIHSVTTLATPHNGTALADASLLFPSINELLVNIASMGGNNSLSVYDFKLDQWGLKKQNGESFYSYSDRILNSPLLQGTKDISQWDLTTDGARELNEWVKTQSDVYYLSYGAYATQAGVITGFHLPHVTMNTALVTNALFLGSYTRYNEQRPIIDSSWWQNDGLVSTNSMLGPSTGEIVTYNGALQIGKWNHIETKHNWDHGDIVGLSVSDALGFSDITAFYRSVAERVTSLPK